MKRDRILALALIVLALAGFGCSSWKATDNTKVVDYITRGEMHPQVMEVPGELLDLPGKSFKVASTPGKNVTLTLNYPDGTLKASLKTERSAVIDRIIAGALGLNMAAFEEGGKEFDRFFQVLQYAVATARSAGYLSPPSAPVTQPGGPSAKDDLIREILEAIKAEIRKTPPGTSMRKSTPFTVRLEGPPETVAYLRNQIAFFEKYGINREPRATVSADGKYATLAQLTELDQALRKP